MSTLYGNNRSTLSHEILGEIIANGQAFRDSYLKSLDPEQWAVESFLLARTTVVRWPFHFCRSVVRVLLMHQV